MSTDTNTKSVEALAGELAAYNAWRRSENDSDMPSPLITGCMLDEVGAALRTLAAERDALTRERDQWRNLYRRAVNEANGLTNYVEDRPELRRAERNLSAIEAEARVLSPAPTAPNRA